MSVGTFSVSSATYDGTYPTPPSGQGDPLVCIQGNVSGFNGFFPPAGVVSNFTFRFVTYLLWNQIQNANLSGGQASVQNLIAIAVQNSFLGTSVPHPVFPVGTNIPAPVTGGPASSGYLGGTTCSQAMVGNWTA
jgi:hypothetical protein